MDDDGVLTLFILIGAVLLLAVLLYANNASLVNQTQDNGQSGMPPVTPYCGDGICNNGETCSICSQDCGSCPPLAPYCGDSICNNGETCLTCSQDCGACQPYCGDDICQSSETCSNCPTDCGVCKVESSYTTFNTFENIRPYYGLYCDKINPYDLDVRKAASEAVAQHPGKYSIDQLLDIYDWVKSKIEYLNVPATLTAPYQPSGTLATKSGDCKNQAVLIASMIESIGGTAKVVINTECNHSYTIVFFARPGTDMSDYVQTIAYHYHRNVIAHWYTNNEGIWMIFDPAGGTYPGETLSDCLNANFYTVTGCLACGRNYPNMPYTYGDKCYAQCPSGTVSGNNYSCESCSVGYYSYNNQCVTCPAGYVLHTNGRCYPE